MFILGRNFSPLASETRVKEPVIKACEAMMAATVAKITANILKLAGIDVKKGLISAPLPL